MVKTQLSLQKSYKDVSSLYLAKETINIQYNTYLQSSIPQSHPQPQPLTLPHQHHTHPQNTPQHNTQKIQFYPLNTTYF